MQSSAITDYIWRLKYRHAAEATPAATLRRVATAVAAAEADPASWNARYDALLQSGCFLPGGRILAGAGTGRDVTLFNCFVAGLIPDDLAGICAALGEAALTMQAGGGIGCDFSTLRPHGFAARSTGNVASGPVSFMQVWNAMCATLLSGSGRRGAMIATLRCDHPDIARFIDAKRERGVLEHFNLSVQVSDAFMQAVALDRPWALLFPLQEGTSAEGCRVELRHWPGHAGAVPCAVTQEPPARQLWQQLMAANYDSGEPGVLFVDRINAMNNLHWRETLTCTNPCGEIPLPPHGACDLGSLVLPRFVCDAFTPAARLDLAALDTATAVAVRFLDAVIDCSRYPLPAQAAMARSTRRIGLGLTGLADALLMLGLHYGSAEARQAAQQAMQTICLAAYRSSCALAREKGAFPAFEREPYLAGNFIRQLPDGLRDVIATHGIRNSHLLAIAPAGTISLLAGNVSSGIEPVFAWEQRRGVLDAAGTRRELQLVDPAWQQWRERHGVSTALPSHFVTADALAPREHLLMQAALQPWVDSAISKTVNVPADCSRADFADLYLQAHALGLKGCTTFRSGCRDHDILQAEAACNVCETE